jgi:hypothetical protein
MSETKNNRNEWLHIRLTEGELEKLNKGFEKSTSRKLSEYARRILLEKPITYYQRNQSIDDFVTEMILLRNELSAIGNNFNQAVKKLHTLDYVPEIKIWAMHNDSIKEKFMQKTEEIKLHINKFSDQWLQE